MKTVGSQIDDRSAKRRTLVVAMRRLKCPKCESVNVRTTGTLESTPEFLSQRKRCNDCGFAFQANFD